MDPLRESIAGGGEILITGFPLHFSLHDILGI